MIVRISYGNVKVVDAVPVRIRHVLELCERLIDQLGLASYLYMFGLLDETLETQSIKPVEAQRPSQRLQRDFEPRAVIAYANTAKGPARDIFFKISKRRDG